MGFSKRLNTAISSFRRLRDLSPREVNDFLAAYIIYDMDWDQEEQRRELGPRYQEKKANCLKVYYEVVNNLCALGNLEKMYIPPLMDKGASVRENQLLYERSIANHIDIQPGNKVLDMGCGRGCVAAYMARITGAEITGLNIDSSQIAIARNLNMLCGLSNKFIEQDFNTLPLPFDTSSFDGFYQIQTLSLCNDLVALCKEICRIVKPGAKISFLDLVMLPAYDPTNPKHFELMQRVKPLIGAVAVPSPSDLEGALKEAGLRIIQSGNVSLDGLQAPLIDRVDKHFQLLRRIVLVLVKGHVLPMHFQTILNRLCRDGQMFVTMDRMRLISTSYSIIAEKPLVL